ncbi:MAG: hypothetical protein LUD50_03150 [Clostridia bacterium]|nr:hypothetical protein [Clostridia bacterium]
MNWQEIVTALVAVMTALGGWEAIKYLINRKSNARKNNAEASGAEFAVLKEMVEFLSKQLAEKEERFADQTQRLRDTQSDLMKVTREKAELELKEQRYHCEVAHCPNRQPPNGY